MTDYDRPATYQDVLAMNALAIAAVFVSVSWLMLEFNTFAGIALWFAAVGMWLIYRGVTTDGVVRGVFRRLGVEVPTDD